MRDITETMAVPALLCVLGATLIVGSGLNIPLFLALQHFSAQLPDAFWSHATLLGDALVTLVLLGFTAFRFPALLPAGLLGGALTTLLVRTLKPTLDIERPLAVLGEHIHTIGPLLKTASFPSGHTTAAFLLAGVYALALRRDRLTALLFSTALLVAYSRIAVGAHWPADVLAGAAIGWSCAWAGWKLAQHWRWGKSMHGQRILAILFLVFSLLLFWLDSGYPQAFWLQMLIALSGTLASLANVWRTWRRPVSNAT